MKSSQRSRHEEVDRVRRASPSRRRRARRTAHGRHEQGHQRDPDERLPVGARERRARRRGRRPRAAPPGSDGRGLRNPTPSRSARKRGNPSRRIFRAPPSHVVGDPPGRRRSRGPRPRSRRPRADRDRGAARRCRRSRCSAGPRSSERSIDSGQVLGSAGAQRPGAGRMGMADEAQARGGTPRTR